MPTHREPAADCGLGFRMHPPWASLAHCLQEAPGPGQKQVPGGALPAFTGVAAPN